MKGYLYKLPVTSKFKRWSKRWFVLYDTSLDGVVRIDYYETESKHLSDSDRRTIPLRGYEDLQQISGDEIHTFVFEFTTQIGRHIFACDSQAHLNQWVEAIKDAVSRDRLKMRKAKAKSISRDGVDGYINAPTSGTYRVFMDENETTQRLNLSGAYNLEVTPEHITLTSTDSKVQMARWYYKELKNYGKKTGLVSFEAGKKAGTGEGKFIFKSSCSRDLFTVLDANIRRLCQEKNKKDKQEATAMVENIKKQKGKGKAGGFTHSNSSYDTRIEVVEGTQGAYHTKKADPFDVASVYDSLEPTQPQSATATHQKGISQRSRGMAHSVSSEGDTMNPAALYTNSSSAIQPLSEGAHNPLGQMDPSIGIDDIDESFIEILANMEENSAASTELQTTPMMGQLSSKDLEKEWENICASLPKAHEI
eukprot:Em0013g571a